MPRSRAALSVALLTFLAASSEAGVDLVADIDSAVDPGSSFILPPIVELSNGAVFALDDGVHGTELWRTDGTAAGTRLLLDINPGKASSDPAGFTVLNGVAYFRADDGTNGTEIWRTDGTVSGTTIVTDIDSRPAVPGGTAGNGAVNFPYPAVLNGIMYFPAIDSTGDAELWRSDGTRLGTWRVADIAVGAASSAPEMLTVAAGRVFFVADDGNTGRELWSTDGTAAGTQRFADINPGAAGADIGEMTFVGNHVFLTANNGAAGREVWYADVTNPASVAQKDLKPGPMSSLPAALMPFGDGVVYFAYGTTTDPVSGATVPAAGLFRTTANGTTTFLASLPEPPEFLTTIGGTLLFADGGTTRGAREPWTTDGTPAGTVPLLPGRNLRVSGSFVGDGNGAFLFQAAADALGSPPGIWRTDGTAAGTKEWVPNTGSGGFIRNGGAIYYAGSLTDTEGAELRKASGMPPVTELVKDINPGPGHSSPTGFDIVAGRVLFLADDGVHGTEPWISDGTNAGTLPLGDLTKSSATAASNPSSLTPFAGGVLFSANDGVAGEEPWFSDGTAAGTRLLADIASGVAGSSPGYFLPMNGFVLFVATTPGAGAELFRTDATPAGTTLVADINPGGASSNALQYGGGTAVVNGVAYFRADDGSHGLEMWQSDGTPGGTRLAFDLRPGPEFSTFELMGTSGGRLVFSFATGSGSELWATDAGRATAGRIASGLEVLDDGFATLGSYVYFVGRDAQGRIELWRTDGTGAGTVPVTTLNASSMERVMATTTKVLFNACPAAAACGLYATTGQAGLEQRLSDATAASLPMVANGAANLTFVAEALGGRIELLTSDGTGAGTRDLFAGSTPPGDVADFVRLRPRRPVHAVRLDAGTVDLARGRNHRRYPPVRRSRPGHRSRGRTVHGVGLQGVPGRGSRGRRH